MLILQGYLHVTVTSNCQRNLHTCKYPLRSHLTIYVVQTVTLLAPEEQTLGIELIAPSQRLSNIPGFEKLIDRSQQPSSHAELKRVASPHLKQPQR